MTLVDLIRRLDRRIRVPGVEVRIEVELRLIDRVELLAPGRVEPDLVALDRTAEIDVDVVIALDLVAAGTQAKSVDLLVAEVRRLQAVVVPVGVQLT